ncbi:hypothetical protein PINS_up015346 [Pythium insidiosum]|nr:hypothetical protein PINS_up015346 [Pythium insidiosum]
MADVHPLPLPLPSAPKRRWRRLRVWLRRAAVVFTGVGGSGKRYTTAKYLALIEYTKRTSVLRLMAVILLYPLPPLLTAVVPSLFPLEDPSLGISRNWGILCHFTVLCFVASIGSMTSALVTVGVLHSFVSVREIVVISALAAPYASAGLYLLAATWRFPVPFAMSFLGLPWGLGLVVSTLVVLRQRLTGPDPTLREAIAASSPAASLQAMQLFAYPALSVLFKGASEWQQVLLTLALPMMKHAVKRFLRRAGRHLGEFAEEVAVSGVEIAASMYQTTLMQNAPTVLSTAVIIGVDVAQGMLAVRLFMDKSTQGKQQQQQRELLTQASALLASQAVTEDDLSLGRTGTATYHSFATVSVTLNKQQHDHVVAVQQALEIAQVAENILLTEYCEVALPVVNGLFLAMVSSLESSRFNPTICALHYHPSRLSRALQNLAIYSTLQGLTVVLMMLVMWRRYRVSSLAQLAFVLERHVWSLQGKLLVWLPLFVHFSLVHYGACHLSLSLSLLRRRSCD